MRKGLKELMQIADGLKVIHKHIQAKKIPRSRFNMKVWATEHTKKKLDLNNDGFDCGFAGCAIGWAPKFVKNFPFAPSDQLDHYGFVMLAYKGEALNQPLKKIGPYFGISEEDAYSIFIPTKYYTRNPSPLVVATKIKEVVDKYVQKEKNDKPKKKSR